MSEILAQQYLTVTLDNSLYALPVARVLEVLERSRITKLPRTAAYMKGLIDLRGRGIPVLDMRLRFGMPEAAETDDTAIVVVELAGEDGVAMIGLIADAVHEVLEIAPAEIEPAPRFGVGPAAAFLSGVSRVKNGEFVLILELDRVFDGEDLGLCLAAEAVEA